MCKNNTDNPPFKKILARTLYYEADIMYKLLRMRFTKILHNGNNKTLLIFRAETPPLNFCLYPCKHISFSIGGTTPC